MLYAAAINDNNPAYLDDERDEGIIAHPMFPVTLTLPIVENLGSYISGESASTFPYEILMTVVHYSEYLKIHRLIKPDDELIIKTRFIAMLPHRAGTHAIICLEAKDKKEQPVFTEYLGGMLRGVEYLGEAVRRDLLPSIPHYTQQEKPSWKKELFIDPLRPYIYDGCAGTTLPIHTSKEFAHQVGLPDIILQGVCTLAFAVREIINEEANGKPTKVTDIACKFTAMVIPDSTIRLELNKKIVTEEGREIFFEVYNEENRKAIREGYVRMQ
jgi:acyl dehydratase